jgi:capsid protein
VRAVSWFAPIILPAKDLDEYGDAQLMKQKIAACLAVITSDVDGSAAPLGTADDTQSPAIDMPRAWRHSERPAGRSVDVVQPPTVGDYEAVHGGQFAQDREGPRAVVRGLHRRLFEGELLERADVAHRALRQRIRLALAAARAAVLQSGVDAGRCRRCRSSANVDCATRRSAQWTPPPMPMIEPDKEGLAIMRNVRAGIQTLSGCLRERGYDPDVQRSSTS